jgi:hypothetical protein
MVARTSKEAQDKTEQSAFEKVAQLKVFERLPPLLDKQVQQSSKEEVFKCSGEILQN